MKPVIVRPDRAKRLAFLLFAAFSVAIGAVIWTTVRDPKLRSAGAGLIGGGCVGLIQALIRLLDPGVLVIDADGFGVSRTSSWFSNLLGGRFGWSEVDDFAISQSGLPGGVWFQRLPSPSLGQLPTSAKPKVSRGAVPDVWQIKPETLLELLQAGKAGCFEKLETYRESQSNRFVLKALADNNRW